MEVILLEKIRNLGDIGAKTLVKPGYARNYLIPYGKAVLATPANLEKFARMREELERKAAVVLEQAKQRAIQVENSTVTIAVKATEEGKLFGSVSAADIVVALKVQDIVIEKNEIHLPQGAIRQTGEYEVALMLHSDVTSKIKVKVAVLA